MFEIEKGKFSKDKKLLLLLLLGGVGVALLLFGGGKIGVPSTAKADSKTETRGELAEYTDNLRNSIKELCEQVGGVSDVTVAVTLESGFEYVYAADSKTENGASGSESQLKYITIGSGSSEGTVYITEKLPKIGGIGVVCRGGSDPETVRKLTSLISAAYNIGTNKIYITGT